MNKHILLLHIGIPKTGTSALQRFLFHNMDNLKKYGWSYPDLRSVIGDINSYSIGYINATALYKSEGVLDVYSENWVYAWKFLKKELENYNVILSAEQIFDWQHEERILREIKKEYCNVKVIIYLRRQDLFLESYWAQLVKSDNWVKSFEESLPEIQQYTRYLDLLYKISGVIGKENLIVRIYEREQFKGNRNDIFSDFIEAIGVKPDWAEFNEVGVTNESLFGNYLELRRVFNSLKKFDDAISGEYKQLFLILSHSLPRFKKVKGYFRTKEDRENFLSQYQEENKIIAEQFVHNEDGVLFYDRNTDIPFSGVEISEFEEDLIRLFGYIVYDLKIKNKFLEKNLKKTTEMLLNMQRKDRKIVYFGGGHKCAELLQQYDWDVEMILDNDREKEGSQMRGVSVVHPLSVNDWKELFIIITCIDTKDIKEQLESIGLIKDVDFVLAQEFLY